MTTHIIFFGFTQQGIEKIKDSPSRIEDAKKAIESTGGKVKDFYGLAGMAGYDTLFIVDTPDDEALARAVLSIASRGNVRTTTARAFGENEYKRIIAGLP